jgi:carboxylesterase type B
MGVGIARVGTLASAEGTGANRAACGAACETGAGSFTAVRGGNLVDGYLIPDALSQTFANGRQNSVDLLIGSNKDDSTFFQRPGLTAQQFTRQAKQRFGVLADGYLKIVASFSDEAPWRIRKFARCKRNNATAPRRVRGARGVASGDHPGRRGTGAPKRAAASEQLTPEDIRMKLGTAPEARVRRRD